MSDDRYDGLSPAGPADVASGGMPLATPPLTDGHVASEEAGLQVQFDVQSRVMCPAHRIMVLYIQL